MNVGYTGWFLDALASLEPILFTESVSQWVIFFGIADIKGG